MKEREKHWKMMKKQGQKTMKNDDQERKKQWKMMKKRETKTMKND